MALKEPESMNDLVYFTRRAVGDGKVMAWVYKKNCPECNKEKMGKPVDKKTGKVKTRSDKYVCGSCGYEVPKKEYEESLECEIKYTCPSCKHDGDIAVPFKRKRVQLKDAKTGKKKAVDAIVFNCEKCDEKILITKKMKS